MTPHKWMKYHYIVTTNPCRNEYDEHTTHGTVRF